MSTRELIDEEDASNARDEIFNGAELSESVLARDWNSPEEEAAWLLQGMCAGRVRKRVSLFVHEKRVAAMFPPSSWIRLLF